MLFPMTTGQPLRTSSPSMHRHWGMQVNSTVDFIGLEILFLAFAYWSFGRNLCRRPAGCRLPCQRFNSILFCFLTPLLFFRNMVFSCADELITSLGHVYVSFMTSDDNLDPPTWPAGAYTKVMVATPDLQWPPRPQVCLLRIFVDLHTWFWKWCMSPDLYLFTDHRCSARLVLAWYISDWWRCVCFIRGEWELFPEHASCFPARSLMSYNPTPWIRVFEPKKKWHVFERGRPTKTNVSPRSKAFREMRIESSDGRLCHQGGLQEKIVFQAISFDFFLFSVEHERGQACEAKCFAWPSGRTVNRVHGSFVPWFLFIAPAFICCQSRCKFTWCPHPCFQSYLFELFQHISYVFFITQQYLECRSRIMHCHPTFSFGIFWREDSMNQSQHTRFYSYSKIMLRTSWWGLIPLNPPHHRHRILRRHRFACVFEISSKTWRECSNKV